MLKRIVLAVICSSFLLLADAQSARLNGRVVNDKNEPLPGASVFIDGTKTGTSTDLDGKFTLTLIPSRKYIITISLIGYAEKRINEVEVLTGQLNELNVLMEVQAKTGDAVVLTTSARKESVNAMIGVQRSSAPVAQVVSAEAIRKSPDPNTGEVLKRVSGIALQEGKYIIVRGLADRYNQTMVNGALMSSTEPDRKTFSYDIFPSSTIENIIVNKTAIPELPGEFSGGLVQLTTKEIPSQPFLNIGIGTGINLQTIGKDFYTYKGGKLDWLGIDDGTRALPAAFPVVRGKFVNESEAAKYDYAKMFNNIWAVQKEKGAPNASFNINGGWATKGNDINKWGFIYALTYTKKNKTIEQSRTFQDQTGQVIQDFDDKKYSQDVQIGVLGNISYQLNKNNKFSIKNTFNIIGSDYTLLRNGRNADAGNIIRSQELAFRQSYYYTGQLSGDHHLVKPGLKIHWIGSFTTLYQGTPDQRRLAYVKAEGQPDSEFKASIQNGLPSLSSGIRFFSDLVDYVYSGTADVSKTFKIKNYNQTLKAGYLFQYKDRLFSSRPLGVAQFGANEELLKLSPDKIFAPENFGPGKFKMDEINNRNFDYMATGSMNAAFIQFDNQLNNKIRIVWGARTELFRQTLDGANNSNRPVTINTDVTDFLPSANLTYKLNTKTNIKLAASQTLIRPEFRELAPFEFFDFELVAGIKGNENLKRTKITNLDLRYEIYPKAGELVTAGIFYKSFQNPIEPFLNQTGPVTFNIGYDNAPSAKAFGVEFDIRKKLSKLFTASSNLTYIYNKVDFGSNSTLKNRPMQGQSPYVVNMGLEFTPSEKTTATVLLNQVGRRIYFVGLNEFPSVWEAPRALFDFQLNHKIMKGKAELKVSATDILNAKAVFYQDVDENGKFNSNKDFEFRRYNSGTNINVAFSYKLK
jgi:outer membrane receptor protein involved in Fe transport